MAMHTTIAVIALALAGCDRDVGRQPEFELAGEVMGTTYSVKLIAPAATTDLDELGMLLDERLRAIDGRMSTYKPESEISRFNDSTSRDWIDVSEELCTIVDRALAISEQTGGTFDVTVGPLVDLWGFGATGNITGVPSDQDIAAIREQVGYRQLDADCSKPALRKNRDDVSVDLSAFAKGYAVDEAAEMLITAGQASFLVEVGGELRMQGTNAAGEPWAIAVERPNVGERSVESVLHLTNTALATSGDYRNFYEFDGKRFSHTIDPRTARPVTHDGASVTVVAESAANADALATALLVMGPVDGLEFAAANDIAAFFLLRTDRGFEQRATGSFAKQVRK